MQFYTLPSTSHIPGYTTKKGLLHFTISLNSIKYSEQATYKVNPQVYMESLIAQRIILLLYVISDH